ncbi:MAG: hypothetical protein J6C84_10275 [Lachnospiraceae bacterium]|nr:hypothetical protein [Lachnospiraceae bacterium]
MQSEENNSYVPFNYQPISMWGYIGYQLLFSIPCIGFILILVFSFGGAKNVNLRNFARSYLCIFVIAFVFALIIMLLGGGAALLGSGNGVTVNY